MPWLHFSLPEGYLPLEQEEPRLVPAGVWQVNWQLDAVGGEAREWMTVA
jgi:hypothetical protein